MSFAIALFLAHAGGDDQLAVANEPVAGLVASELPLDFGPGKLLLLNVQAGEHLVECAEGFALEAHALRRRREAEWRLHDAHLDVTESGPLPGEWAKMAATCVDRSPHLSERGYPTRMTGYYTSEPVYGDLVRTAFKLGYRVVPYEWAGEYTPDNRERGQARNLVERILKDNPKAKILVHAGYDHIDETGELVGAKTMAQRLKQMTGIDPLTIDQTEMTEHSAPEYERPL